MKRLDDLKNQEEGTAGNIVDRSLIEKAEEKLTDDELNMVTGGGLPEMMGLDIHNEADKDSPWNQK